jgi:serine/threonine-protein kinase RsbT
MTDPGEVRVEEATEIPVASDADVVTARFEGRSMAEQVGFTATDLTLIATAISEVARNITTYAGSGEIHLQVVCRGQQRGITVVALDKGPGIADLELAMTDGYTTANGMGLGLPGTRRLMDEFEIWTEVGAGTRVTLRKWLRA